LRQLYFLDRARRRRRTPGGQDGGRGLVDAKGIAHLVESPDEILVIVCGGLGNLHAMGLHNFGPTRAVTRGIGRLESLSH